MFKSREYFAGQAAALECGPADGAAVLSQAQILRESSRLDLPALARRLSQLLAHPDMVVDLGENIGSARWFRGLGTMAAFGIGALSFWPDFSPLAAASPAHLESPARDEFRSQMILPLALGADSGRHMGATAAVVPLRAAPERPRIEMVATLAQGDGFARMLQRIGVGAGDAERVTQLVSASVPLQDIAPGTRIDLTLGQRPQPGAARPLEAMKFRARFDLELALVRKGGALAIDARPIPVSTTPLRIRGKVGASLYRSARSAGAPAGAVQQYLRTLDQKMRLDSDILPDDNFDIILSFRRAATGETQEGELIYAGLERGGKPQAQLLRWGKDGQFLEASGAGEQRGGFVTPVNGRITSGFGMRRHPLLGYTRMHAGIDFGAGHGSPIFAASDGTVSFAGWHGGHGNFVRLSHGGGIGTGYGHMSRIAVSSGEQVRAGQVIGYVGSTGLSTGPHLHYEVYRNGRVVNPASVQFTMRAQLEGEELERFRARLGDLMKLGAGASPT